MDIKQLEAFLALVDHDKMQDAAQALGLSQSSTSFRLQQLEKALGYNLFNRDNRTLALTDEGRALIPYARQILSLRQEASLAVQTAQEVTHNALHIFVSNTALLAYTQTILQSLDKPPQHLQIDLISRDAFETNLMLVPHALFISHHQAQLKNIQIKLEQTITYHALFDAQHPLAQITRALKPTDLHAYPTLYASDLPRLNWHSQLSSAIPAISLPQFLAKQQSVALLPSYFTDLYTQSDQFMSATLDTTSFDLPTSKIYVITNKHLSLSAYQDAFLSHLTE